MEAQSQLYASEFVKMTAAGLVVQDAAGVIVDCNEAAAATLGLTRDQVVGRASVDPRWAAVRENGSRFPVEEHPGMVTLRSGTPCTDVIMGVDNPGRARRWISVSSRLAGAGRSEGVIVSFVDVTARVQREHMLNLLTDVNRYVMFAADEAELLQHLCDGLVQEGRYALAWIAFASGDEEGDVGIDFSAGTTDYLYDEIVSSSASRPTGLGPTGTALRTGVTQVANDLANQPLYGPWRERAKQFGLSSAVAIPFHPGRRGVLTVYDHHIVAFDETTVQGLEEMVRGVEFGVEHVRALRQTEVSLKETVTAIEAQRAEAQARAESEQRFRLAFENNMAPMTCTDLEDRITAINDAYCRLVGRTREELLGQKSTPFTYPDDVGITEEAHRRLVSGEVDQIRYVKRYLHSDGRVLIVEVSKSPVRDAEGAVLYFVVSQRDITDEQALTAQLSHLALHDQLTGLANRSLFEDRLAQAHSRAARQGGLGAVLLLDLDDFKGVNDTHGHLVGDQMLVAIARRFEQVTRSSDTLCRLGGDEFLYLAEGLTAVTEAEIVAARLLDTLAEPFSVAGVHLEQQASIGIVIFDGRSTDYTQCVRDADVALYEAKRQGKGHHVVFTATMHEQAASRFELLQDLRRAPGVGEISMHYQPIVDLSTYEVIGLEALMRWRHLERGQVPPSVFIPLAEQSDLIVELGTFALREAAIAASSWGPASDGSGPPFVSVNLSAHQFQDPGLVGAIEDLVARTGITPERLVLEITESVALLDISATLAVTERLSRLGIGIALDDFGTGFSSLSYLALMHPRIIKIDQSFVRPSGDDVRNDVLLETIVSLGKKLDMTMLAEGIETQAQLERLRRFQCDLGQGFLFSAAVPAGDVAATLEQITGMRS